MISHKYKAIFVHIPKTAGSSVNKFLSDGKHFDWKIPNYEYLYGWCPKRKIHLQHATAEQLIKLELISPKVWKEYFKFTFVRNPWDRAYSDYLWIMEDTLKKGTFEEYIYGKGEFSEVLKDNSSKSYRGDHLFPQTKFFDIQEGLFKMDFLGKFENFNNDFNTLRQVLGVKSTVNNYHEKKNVTRGHFMEFYDEEKLELVWKMYGIDARAFNYSFPNHNLKKS